MKIAMLMGNNCYTGREYLNSMNLAKVNCDLIYFGNSVDYDDQEENRCGSLWKPKSFHELLKIFPSYWFSNLKDANLSLFFQKNKYDLIIQGGGLGIISKGLLKEIGCDILNFHPGDLPSYRGCSAPEWQYVHGKPIICTCHVIDEGIDTGPIFKKKILQLPFDNYYKFRSSIYPECAKFLIEVLREIKVIGISKFKSQLQPQAEIHACYRKYIGDSTIETIKFKMNNTLLQVGS